MSYGNIAWFTSTRDGIDNDNDDLILWNIFRYNAAAVTILNKMVEIKFRT